MVQSTIGQVLTNIEREIQAEVHNSHQPRQPSPVDFVTPMTAAPDMAMPDYVEHSDGATEIGRLSAEAVVREYEAAAKDIEALMALVERDPTAALRIDLGARTCTAPGMTVPIAIPDHVRDALMTGAWDTPGLLLDNYAQVAAVGSKLPYIGGFRQ